MNGKTSKPRPYSIPLVEYGKRYDEIFRRRELGQCDSSQSYAPNASGGANCFGRSPTIREAGGTQALPRAGSTDHDPARTPL